MRVRDVSDDGDVFRRVYKGTLCVRCGRVLSDRVGGLEGCRQPPQTAPIHKMKKQTPQPQTFQGVKSTLAAGSHSNTRVLAQEIGGSAGAMQGQCRGSAGVVRECAGAVHTAEPTCAPPTWSERISSDSKDFTQELVFTYFTPELVFTFCCKTPFEVVPQMASIRLAGALASGTGGRCSSKPPCILG